MGKIFYLMGKSSSGKDTIFKELQGEVATIVPYTTRPIREGERDGVEYHFTDEAGFEKLLADTHAMDCGGILRRMTVSFSRRWIRITS